MSRRNKDKYVTQKLSDNVQIVRLAIDVQPKMKMDANKGIIKFGLKNDYPDYLINLFKNSTAHGAICTGKARYLSGLNIKPKEENPVAEAWLKKIKAHALVTRLDLDEVISGGEYVLVNPNIIGQPTEFKHLYFAKCRISDCYGFVVYSEDWSSQFCERISYPIWREGITTTAVMVYKRYTPTIKKLEATYPTPEWAHATLDIDTDWEISTFSNSLTKNSFSIGKIITIFSGKIPKEKQEELKSEILGDGEGTHNAGGTAFVFTGENAKGAEIAEAGATELDKQYQEIRKAGRENILLGHNVSGSLFKVKVGDTAWTRSDLVEAHELFMNEYVKPKQERRLKQLSYWYKLRTGLDVEFEFEQIKTIGLELPLENQTVVNALNSKDPNIITDYIIEKYGIKIPEKLDPTTGQPITATQTAINDNLKGLSAAENADAIRIVRDFKKGRMPEAMALSRLMSYGLTDVEARKWLDMPQAAVEMAAHQCDHVHLSDKHKSFLSLFSKYSHEINLEDEELESFVYGSVNLADEVPKDEVKNLVLEALKENPKATQEELAKDLKLSPLIVGGAVAWLIAKKLLAQSEDGLIPTNKGFKTEIYTEYTYELAPEYKGKPLLLSTSHQFCKDMVKETRMNALTFEEIDRMSNEFGENAFDFRGGFTTEKGTGIVKPWCRHVWYGRVKVRKVKA